MSSSRAIACFKSTLMNEMLLVCLFLGWLICLFLFLKPNIPFSSNADEWNDLRYGALTVSGEC